MRKRLIALFLVSVMMLGNTVAFAEENTLVTRSEAEDKYKWDLTEFYASREAFEESMDTVVNVFLPKLAAYQGKLVDAKSIKEFIELDIETSLILEYGYVYANLSLDLDQSNGDASEMSGIAGSVYSQYMQATAFAQPEILALDDETMTAIIDDPMMVDYKHYLEKMVASKAHTLSAEEENILSSLSEVTSAPRSIFDKVVYGDYKAPTIKDADGNDLELTQSVYYNILDTSKDRDLRMRAYIARAKSYGNFNNALAQIYLTEVKANVAEAKVRGYDSAIDAALSSEFVPASVYNNLIEAVNKNLEPLHKYYQMKKDALGYEELHGYDTSIPIVGDYTMELPYDQGVELIAKGLKPLGEGYIKDFHEGINSRWVDVYEDSNKYTGGYQWGTYLIHPFILMNYDNTLDSTLTLAHEMGHALNTKYSNEEQNYINANYPIFTAEVASIANELLVMDHLIKNAKTDEEKLFLLNKQIENIRGTMYVQVMFSEFESTIHSKVESGEPVSADTLNNLWIELIQKYYGEAYTVDPESGVTWSRIPHFYMNFYVYKYATSMSAAFKIVNNIVNEEEGAVDKYMAFLEAGGSDYPIDILKEAGVDMNSSAPVDELLEYFNGLVEQMDELLKAK